MGRGEEKEAGRTGARGWRLEIERNHGEVGGSGAEISFYGRVTNLRTRHCRVPADGRTMRLRNTMLHSGNLKAVLTTNLQPPIPPPYVWSPLSLISSPPPLLSTNTRFFDTYHPLDCRPHYPAVSGPHRYFLILLPLLPLPLLSLYQNLPSS